MKHASEDVIRLPDGCVFTASCHAFAMERAADAGYPDATCERSELGFSRPDGTGFVLAGMTLLIQGLQRTGKKKSPARRVNDNPWLFRVSRAIEGLI
jgi:hypothetical protein